MRSNRPLWKRHSKSNLTEKTRRNWCNNLRVLFLFPDHHVWRFLFCLESEIGRPTAALMVVTWLALILLTSVGRFGIEAHVAWLFPAPREPAFDSLNFDQNTQPCGGVASKENGNYLVFEFRVFFVCNTLFRNQMLKFSM